jgi:hypothetical protein
MAGISRLAQILKLIEASSEFWTAGNELFDRYNLAAIDGDLGEVQDDFAGWLASLKERWVKDGADDKLAALNGLLGKAPSQPRQLRGASVPLNLPDSGCDCGRSLVLDEARYVAICPSCGLANDLVGLQVSESSTRTPHLSDALRTKWMETFNKTILFIQGQVPVKSLQLEIDEMWPRIEEHLKNQCVNRETMPISEVRTVLRNADIRRFCKAAPYLHRRYTGKTSLILRLDEIQYLFKMYLEVLTIWEAFPKKAGEIQNLPNCPMIIFELIEISTWSHSRKQEIETNIYHLDKSTVTRFRKGMWGRVCAKSTVLKYIY